MGWIEGCGKILERVGFTVSLSGDIWLSLSLGLVGIMPVMHRFEIGSMSASLTANS